MELFVSFSWFLKILFREYVEEEEEKSEEISDFSLPYAKKQKKLKESFKIAIDENKRDYDDDAENFLKARRKTAAEKFIFHEPAD